MGVEYDGKAEGGGEGGGGGRGALRPLRVGENLGLGMSRQGQPQLELRYGGRMASEPEYGILMARGGGWGGLHDQQLSIDQRLKNCALKSLLTSKS